MVTLNEREGFHGENVMSVRFFATLRFLRMTVGILVTLNECEGSHGENAMIVGFFATLRFAQNDRGESFGMTEENGIR